VTSAEACHLLVETTRRLSQARRETAAYRVLAQQALHFAHEQHVEIERLKARHERLVDEYREYRVTTTKPGMAA